MYIWISLLLIASFLVVMIFFTSQVFIRSYSEGNFSSHAFELRFIFGLLHVCFQKEKSQHRVQIKLGELNLFSKKLKPSKQKKEKPEPVTAKPSIWKRIHNITRSRSLPVKKIKVQLIRILKGFRHTQIRGHFRLGFGNPMYTGLLMGIYSMIGGIWPIFRRGVTLQPVFIRSEKDWYLTFRTNFILAHLIWRGFLIWRYVRQVK